MTFSGIPCTILLATVLHTIALNMRIRVEFEMFKTFKLMWKLRSSATTRTVSSSPGPGMIGILQTQQRGANFLWKSSIQCIWLVASTVNGMPSSDLPHTMQVKHCGWYGLPVARSIRSRIGFRQTEHFSSVFR
uniref:Uncharacterized protein n=1 Tax=Anopheles coluzzii TaxID=1518534 RepID=A0A8W7PJ87_ANOCL